MWKSWINVTEKERNEIAKIADEFDVSRREVANMFQLGLSFSEIVTKLTGDRENGV